MSTIDERIVSMVFENAKFEAGVAQTMATLTKLDDSLKKMGQTTALGDIEKQANKVTLQGPMSALDKLRSRLGGAGQGAAEGMSQIESAGNKVQLEQPIRALDNVQSKAAHIGSGAAQSFSEIESASGKVSLQGLNAAMDSVTAKFSVMQGAASVAMGNITSQAALKGGAFAKSFAVGPLQQGFGEYQTNLNSIQTILANTEGQKVSGLDNVNKSLGELNTYSDQTIYNFSEMAKNIGTFTAAGVDLPQSVSSIKGIANLAALSGSSSQQASTAMYQLSQAIAAGRVGLQDWNSVVNAGMGGAKFQQSLMRTAENMGALKKGAVNIDKATGKATVNGESFRNSIMAKPGEESWLTSDVLTKTLSQMTGDMSDAELKAQGFSAEQVKAIQAQAKTAKAAATEVKTLPQVWDVARETIGSGWAQSSQLIFGNFKESKKTFTELSNAVNGVINNMSKARNHILKVWKDLGGRTELINGIKTSFNVLRQVLHAVTAAFRSIFPKATGKDLFETTKRFSNLAHTIQSFVLENRGRLERTFQGFFAILHIGTSIVKGIAGVIAHLFGVVGHGSGGFLNITASIGLWLMSVDKALTKGGLLAKFFERLENILKKPLELIGHLTSSFSNMFGGADHTKLDKLNASIGGVQKAAGPFANTLDKLKSAWSGVVKMLQQAKNLVSPWLDKIGKEFSRIGDAIRNALSGDNVGKTTAILQTAIMGGIFLTIRKLITGATTELGAGLKGIKGVLGGVKDVLGGLTGQLKVMQQKVKAQMILTIAAAVGVLAAATWVIATIPADKLAKAMTAIAVGLGEVMASMKILTGGGFGKGASIATIATGMVLMSGALLILAGAMKVMASMSWEELIKGLVGIGGALTALGVGMKFVGPSALAYAPGILVLSVALNALAIAVKIFATMKWADLARGLSGMLGSLMAIGIGMEAIGPSVVLAAPGILVLAVAMTMLAGAIAIFGNMDMSTLAKGIGAVALSLIAIAIGVAAIPPTVALQAAGLVILAAALQGIAVAVAMFGGLGIFALAKGLIGMGAALLILATGLILMEGSLPGAAALVVAAAGIALLAPAMALLGNLKWSTIFKGLIAMAAGLALLAIAGIFAGPGIAALGIALEPLAGVLILGAGAVFLFAKALAVMGGAGAKGIGVMVAAITAFVLLIPNWIITLLKGLVEVVAEIAKILPKVISALGNVLGQVIAFVIAQAPKLGLAIGILIGQFLKVISDNAPKIIIAGWGLLQKLLSGVVNNIGEVTTKVALIIIRFLDALAAKAPDLVTAGSNMLGKFLTGIGQKAEGLASKAANIVLKFISGIAMKLPELFTIGSKVLAKFIEGVGAHIARLVTAGGQAVLHILTGIGNQVEPLRKKAVWLAGKFISNFVSGIVGLADRVATGIIRLLNGLADVIRKRDKEFWAAARNLGAAIGEGMYEGIKSSLPGPARKLLEGAGKMVKGVKDKFKSHSPSQVFMDIGSDLMVGLAMGIDRGHANASQSANRSATGIVDTIHQTMSNVPGLLDGIMDVDPTITPVLDLTQVKAGAKQIGDITKVPPIQARSSIGQAVSISSEKARIDNDSLAAVAALNSTKPTVHYEQTINSPDPLSTAEIYRRTNNQLSKIRREVGLQ